MSEYKFIEDGRLMATELLSKQHLLSSDPQSLRMNIATLQVAATHVLASLIFNQLKTEPGPIEPLMEKVIWGVRNELSFMNEMSKQGCMVFRTVADQGKPQ